MNKHTLQEKLIDLTIALFANPFIIIGIIIVVYLLITCS